MVAGGRVVAEVVADVGAELTAIAIRVVEDAARPPVAAVEWPIVVIVIAIVIAIVIDAGLVTRWPVTIAGASGKGARRADGGVSWLVRCPCAASSARR